MGRYSNEANMSKLVLFWVRGYYDEALSLVRSVGEIANPLTYFQADQTIKIDR